MVQKAVELFPTVPYMRPAAPELRRGFRKEETFLAELQEYLSLLLRGYRPVPVQIVHPVVFRDFHRIEVARRLNAYPARIYVGKQLLLLPLECLPPSAVCACDTPVHIHGRNVPFQTVHIGGRKDLAFPYPPYLIKIIFVVKHRG